MRRLKNIKSGYSAKSLIVFLLLCLPLVVSARSTEKQLFSAIQQQNTERVEQALQAKTDPNARNPAALISFQTPVSLAVSLGQTEIVALLLKYGADIDLKIGFWQDISPLYIATTKGNLPMVKLLLSAGAKIEPNRWTLVKEIFTAPWHLLQGDVVDLNRPPSLLEAAQKSGNQQLYEFLKKQGAR